MVHWSGRKLADRSQTSETVLFRLVRKLGVDGYKEFKMALLRDESAEQARTELGIFNVPSTPGPPCRSRSRRSWRRTRPTSEQTVRLLVGQPIDEVARELADASLVTLLGMGASLSVASLAENVLVSDWHPVPAEPGLPPAAAPDAPARRSVMWCWRSRSRGDARDRRGARRRPDAGARTVALTAFVPSTVANAADLVIRVPVVNPMRYRVGLVDAVLPYLMIIDLLAGRIGAGRDVQALRERVEDAIQRRKLQGRGPRTGDASG